MTTSVSEHRRLKLVKLLEDYKKDGLSVAALARKYPIDPSHISQLKNKNRGFGEEAARNLEKALELNKFYFEPSFDVLEIDKIMDSAPKPYISTQEDKEKRIMIDLYDVHVCCGEGSDTFGFEPLKKSLPFDESFFKKRNAKPEDCALVYALNDSMAPYINHGDAVMINRASTIPKEGLVYAIWFEGELMFKRVFKESGGVLRLSSDNKNYKDKLVDNENGKDFKILGEQIYRSG